MALQIGELFVRLSAQGLSGVQAALGQVKASLDSVTKGAEAAGNVLTRVFGAAQVAIGGYVTAGLVGTAQGEALAHRFRLISLEIASIFLPAINAAISALNQATLWFRNLTGEQQQSILKWLAAGAAALGVAIVLPKVIAGLTAMVGVVKSLTAAMVAFNISTGGILAALGAIATVFLSLGAGATIAQDGFGGFFDTIKEVMGTLAPAFKQLWDGIQPILSALAESFKTVVQAALPAIQALVQAVGAIAKALAPVIAILAEVAGSVLVAIVPLFTALAEVMVIVIEAIRPLLEAVASFALALATALAPVLKVIAKVLVEVAKALKPVFEVFGKLVASLLKALEPLLPVIAKLVATLLQALVPVIQLLAEVLVIVMEAIQPFVQIIVEVLTVAITALAAVLKILIPVFQALAAVIGALVTIFQAAKEAWMSFFNAMRDGMIWLIRLGERLKLVPKGTADALQRAFARSGQDATVTVDQKLGGKTGKDVPRQQVDLAGGSKESFLGTLSRLQAGALKGDIGGKTDAQKAQDTLDQQLKEQQMTNTLIGNLRPAFVR